MSDIVVKDEKVTLDNIVLDDSVIVDAFERAQKQGQDLDKFLKETLRMGIFVNNAAVDKSKIEELGAKINQLIYDEAKKKSTDANSVAMRLEEHIKLFQATTEANTKYTEDLKTMLHKAQESAAINKATAGTTKAGMDYEQTVGALLSKIALAANAHFRPVGGEYGVSKTKKGDFVIDFAEGSVVFEIKKGPELSGNSQKKGDTMNKIEKEIVSAVKNRDAQHGIYLTKDAANLPMETYAEGIIEKDSYIVCAMEEDGKPLPETFLSMICTMARLRMAARKIPSPASADTVKIQESCEEAKRALKETIKKCKTISSAAKSMEDETLATIKSALESILAATKQQDDAT